MSKSIIYSVKTSRNLSFLFKRVISFYLHRQSASHNQARGHRMAIYANDFIGIEVNSFGLYESEDLFVLFKFLKPIIGDFQNASAIDIGANIGNHSVYFANYFDKIYSFEPNPSTFSLLKANSKWQPKIVPLNYGLGEHNGTFLMQEETENFGASAIVSLELERDASSVSVDIRTLDDHIADFTNAAFMKIDVEGFEAKVLKGGEAFILANEPVIVLEQHWDDFSGDTTPSIELLKQFNYKICWQQNGSEYKSRLTRLFYNLVELLTGRKHKIVTASSVPPGFHPMLIAVPPRFQKRLGL